MMKVFAFVVVAMFFVLGTSATVSSVEEKTLWGQQCVNETGYRGSTGGPEDKRMFWCYGACLYEKSGWMKDGKLAEREKVVSEIAEDMNWIGVQPKVEGTTLRQVAEQCYDEGNAKTEKCEIAGAMAECGARGVRVPANITLSHYI